MVSIAVFATIIALVTGHEAQAEEVHQTAAQQVKLFPLSAVRLLDGPFLRAMEVNREHLLRHDPDRLLAPFLAEAGLEPKAKRYPNWESTGLGGHIAGHYLSALANTYAATGDKECLRRLNYMVGEMARCQQANGDGYVGGVPDSKRLWREIASGNIRSSGFSLNDRWVPFYNLHKTFAGLRDAYLVAGNQEAKKVLIGLADWCARLVSGLSDEQLQAILTCEHGGMNEVLAEVAAITGDRKYLKLAERFSHRTLLDPLAAGQDRLTGMHANTQVPKVIGFQRIAALGGDASYHRAAQFFWDNVVGHRSIAIGGNSISEHFPSPQQSIRWIESREGPETCNTYNMLRLSEQLYAGDPDPRFADFYERALYNHILSTQHPEHGGYVYFTPARPRHYRVYSSPEQSFWCCVGSGMENHTKYGQFIYAHSDGDLYVNLFMASRLTWKEKGVTVEQKTRFPDEPSTRLEFSLAKPIKLTVQVRHPWWVKSGEFRVSVNGKPWPADSEPSSYVAIRRTWHDGDQIEVALPMHTAAEPLPYLDDYVALVHGPIVLAAVTGTDDLDGLVAGTGRMDHVARGPLRPLPEAPMLVTDREDVDQWIEPAGDEPLEFSIAEVVRPDRYADLRLVPFYRVHDGRYMLYWRRFSPEKYATILAEMQAAEEAKIALDRATVDRVAPGEQQPETEHNFRGENTSTGIWQDRRFRHADGWFSYDLRPGNHRKLVLRVTYFGSDRRHFDILVNDRLLKEVNLQAPKPDQFIDVDYPIPAAMLQTADGMLTIKFAAKPNSMAGGIYGVRLLDQETLD